MKEEKKDLFSYLLDSDTDAICITTNPHYSEDGVACMGGGCALEAANRWHQVPINLGRLLKETKMNIPFIIGAIDNDGNYIDPSISFVAENQFKCLIFSFPTINDLHCGSDLELIKESALYMVRIADALKLKQIVSVRFGSGIGGLDWYEQVKPVVEPILDDRFIICCQENDEFRDSL